MTASTHLADCTATELLNLYPRSRLRRRGDGSRAREDRRAQQVAERGACLVDEDHATAKAKLSSGRCMPESTGHPRWRSGVDQGPDPDQGWPTLAALGPIDPKQPWEVDAPVTRPAARSGAPCGSARRQRRSSHQGHTDNTLPVFTSTRGHEDDARRPLGGAAAAVAAGMGPLPSAPTGAGSVRFIDVLRNPG